MHLLTLYFHSPEPYIGDRTRPFESFGNLGRRYKSERECFERIWVNSLIHRSAFECGGLHELRQYRWTPPLSKLALGNVVRQTGAHSYDVGWESSRLLCQILSYRSN